MGRPGEALAHAASEVGRLAASPAACVALWDEVVLPLIEPTRREQARRGFVERVQEDRFRVEFALWAFECAGHVVRRGDVE